MFLMFAILHFDISFVRFEFLFTKNHFQPTKIQCRFVGDAGPCTYRVIRYGFPRNRDFICLHSSAILKKEHYISKQTKTTTKTIPFSVWVQTTQYRVHQSRAVDWWAHQSRELQWLKNKHTHCRHTHTYSCARSFFL